LEQENLELERPVLPDEFYIGYILLQTISKEEELRKFSPKIDIVLARKAIRLFTVRNMKIKNINSIKNFAL